MSKGDKNVSDIITSRQNQWVKRLTEAFRGKGEWASCCLPEGPKLCGEAKAAGLAFKAVFANAGAADEARLLASDGVPLFVLSDSLFKSVSDTVSPQGILAVCSRPRLRPISELDFDPSQPFSLLVLENIQDPGNLGTMLRSASALGWDACLLAGNCADPFKPKALRASMGIAFKISLFYENESNKIINCCRTLGLPIITAAMDGRPLPGFKAPEALSLWIGNEGQGLTAEVLEASDVRLSIPMPGGAESLNAAAAAAILMYRLRENLML